MSAEPSPASTTCTCGIGPDDPANLGRVGDREDHRPETWCRARLLDWVQTDGMNLFHPPAGWFVFGHHVDKTPASGLEFWGQDAGGLPLWERPAPNPDAPVSDANAELLARLEQILDMRLDDGTPVVSVVFALKPELRARFRAWLDAHTPDPFNADCWACAHEAAKHLEAEGDFVGSIARRMYLCPQCGDKRCPKAVNHRNDCPHNTPTEDHT